MKNILIRIITILLFLGLNLNKTYASFNAPPINTIAKQAILVDYETGTVLYEKNGYVEMPPSSMSKLMTAYLIFERLKDGRLSLDDEFTVSENAWRVGGANSGGSTMFLPVNSKVKVQDLLRGIIVQSGNDACMVVAENLSGSEENFAKEMNAKAKELGLENSQFKNATGLTQEGHYMSSYDLAKLSRAIIKKFPEFFAIYSETEFEYNNIKQGNRNPLLYRMSDADGMKTGYTSLAGYGLTGTASRDGRRLIVVVNGLDKRSQRGEEAEKLLNWGFREFDNVRFFAQNEKVGEVATWFGKEDLVGAVVNQDVVITLPKILRRNVAVSMVYDEPIAAPITKGDKIGTLKIKISENDIQEYDLLALSDVKKLGFVKRFFEYVNYKLFGLPVKR